MDGVSAASSILTLVELGKLALAFRQRFNDAPDEIAQIILHIEYLTLKLRMLLETQGALDERDFETQETCRLFQQCIRSTSDTMMTIKAALGAATEKSGVIAQFRWAAITRSKVTRLQGELHRTEDALVLMLQLLQWRQAKLTGESLRQIGVNVAAILVELTEFKRPCDCCQQQQALTSHFDGRDPASQRSSEDKSVLPSTTTYRQLSTAPLNNLGGLNGTTVVTGNEYDRRYVSSFHLRLLSRLMVSIDLTVRLRTSEWLSSLSLTGSKVTLKHLVREDSEFMLASARGDVVTMRRLLGGKKASPYMVADENVTPLALAIQSGVVEAVDLLLTCGADPNDVFGQKQTSPLAWALKWRSLAVARLLMERGASYDHLNIWGWSPLFYLWSRASQHPSSTEYLELLRAQYDFPSLHRGLLDEEGWSVMHRATAFGTPEDVSQLIKYGLDPLEKIVDRDAGDLGWTVLHNVVHYGNVEVFLDLLPHYTHLGVDLPDRRGWTLLHIAAAQGHDAMVRQLLRHGANPHAATQAAWATTATAAAAAAKTPARLQGRRCSVAEVAQAFGEDRYLAFTAAVEDIVGATTDGPEAWHDACEVMGA